MSLTSTIRLFVKRLFDKFLVENWKDFRNSFYKMLFGFSSVALFSALLCGSVFPLKVLILAPSQFHSHLNFNVALARALAKEGHYVVGIFEFKFKLFKVRVHYSILSSWTACLNHWESRLKFRATPRSPIIGPLRKVEMRLQKQWPIITSVIPQTFSSADFTGLTSQCTNQWIYPYCHIQVSSLSNTGKNSKIKA